MATPTTERRAAEPQPGGDPVGTTARAVDATGAPESTPVRSGRRRHRWVWPTLVVVGFVALILAALLRPGGSVHADVADHTGATATLPGLQPGSAVEQQFTARADGLSSVSVRFGTFARHPSCTLDTSIVDDRGAPVAMGVLPCRDIPDTVLVAAAKMDPIADSGGRTYRLRIAMRDQAEPAALTLFGGDPETGQPAAQLVRADSTTHAVEIQTEYRDDALAADQLGLVFDRMATYGAPWHAPIAVIALVLAGVALLAAATVAPRTTGVVLIVAFAVVKGVLWSVVVPPFKGPDEPAHFAYAQFLAVDHQIPKRDADVEGRLGYSDELVAALEVFRQTPADPLLPPADRPDFGPAANDARQRLADEDARSRHASGNSPAAGYPPAYYLAPAAIGAVAPGTIDARLGFMRLWSVALGGLAAWACIMLGRRLFPGHDAAALLLGVAVSLQPMVSQQTAVVTNDALLIAMGAVCTWIAVALTDPMRSRRWPLVAGAALGVGLLAKPLAIVFAPVLVIAWLVGRARGARPAPWWREVGAGALGLAGTYGVWWVFAAAFGYKPVSIPAVPGDRGVDAFVQHLTTDGFEQAKSLWVRQLWGQLGWVNRPLPDWTQQIVLGALVVGTTIVLAWLAVSVRDARRARRGSGPWRSPPGATLAAGTSVCFLVVAGTVALMYVLMYTWFRQTGDFAFIQGRYALMALPAILALPVLALRRLLPKLSPVAVLAAIACAMAVLNVIGLSVLIESSYL